jgi:hypothetical protein
MPKELVSNRLSAFQETDLAFENSGVGLNGLRSSRLRKTKKQMNVKAQSSADSTCTDDSCPTIGSLGTCGPGAAYRRERPRCNPRTNMQMNGNSGFSGTGIEFDAQMSSFNVYTPERRCCPPLAFTDDCCVSFTNPNVWTRP